VQRWHAALSIGLNALDHLPQQVVATVDVADAVHPPAIRDPTRGRLQNRFATDPSKARIWPSPLGPDAQLRSCALVTPVRGSAFKTVLDPHFSAARSHYAAGRSAERWSATGTAVPIIVSKTRTRPAGLSRSTVPTKSANGPDRIRTDCPVVRPASKSARPASSVRAIRPSTTPLGTGTGRSSQVNKEETPTVLPTDNQRSRPRSRIRNM